MVPALCRQLATLSLIAFCNIDWMRSTTPKMQKPGDFSFMRLGETPISLQPPGPWPVAYRTRTTPQIVSPKTSYTRRCGSTEGMTCCLASMSEPGAPGPCWWIAQAGSSPQPPPSTPLSGPIISAGRSRIPTIGGAPRVRPSPPPSPPPISPARRFTRSPSPARCMAVSCSTPTALSSAPPSSGPTSVPSPSVTGSNKNRPRPPHRTHLQSRPAQLHPHQAALGARTPTENLCPHRACPLPQGLRPLSPHRRPIWWVAGRDRSPWPRHGE